MAWIPPLKVGKEGRHDPAIRFGPARRRGAFQKLSVVKTHIFCQVNINARVELEPAEVWSKKQQEEIVNDRCQLIRTKVTIMRAP